MSQLFPKFSNILAPATIILKIGAILTLGVLGWLYVRSPIVTQVDIEKHQPIPFSHEIHVGQLKMDCRYCHTSVEKSNFAGIPSTETCLKCHSVVKKDSPLIAPLHASMASGMSIEWTRIHDLPDHVYFDHSIHINKGVGCNTCHGEIDQMPIVKRKKSLQMGWCLSCHKHPEPNLRPKDEVFNMQWDPKDHDKVVLYREYLEKFQSGSKDKEIAKFQVRKPVNCSMCHR